MPLPSLATVAAMEVRLGLAIGSIADLDLARAETSLADASALVRSVGGKLWVDELGELLDVPYDVEMITARAAVRDYRNIDQVSNEALGQGAYSYTYAEGMSTIYLTDDEVATIRRAALTDPEDPDAWTGTGSVRTPSAYEKDAYGEDLPWYWGW